MILKKQWQICIMLFLATTLNYLDRQTLSILAPALQKEMHLDNEALGWLFAIFYYTYTFSQMVVGPVLDRVNLRWAFATAVFLWSLVSGLTGLANGFIALLIFRLFLGMVESANWPGALRVVARFLEPSERALGNGIFTSGTSVAALIAPGLILAIAGLFGWRWTFVLIGSLGFFWAVGWILVTRDRKITHVWQRSGSAGKGGTGWAISHLRERYPKQALSAYPCGCRLGEPLPLLQCELAADVFCATARPQSWPPDGMDSHRDLPGARSW